MIPPALGTRINGKVFDFSSVTITIGNAIFTNITEISYSHGLDPGILRGTSAKWRGRSRGTYESDAGFSMYKEDYIALIMALSASAQGGYMMATFPVLVMFREGPVGITATDTLNGCRIKHDEDSHSSGNEVAIVKVQLSVFELLRNGLSAVDIEGSVPDFLP
jgi:hypothetical protein